MNPQITNADRFEAWLLALDEICYTELGVSYKNLPEQTYREWFNDGYSAEDAFYELAENCYAGVEFENIQAPVSSTYSQEFHLFTDAVPGSYPQPKRGRSKRYISILWDRHSKGIF